MVRVFTGPGTGVWQELANLSSVSWTESLTAPQTATVRTPLDIAPEDQPAEFIIVPMPLTVPYESVLPRSTGPMIWSLRSTTRRGAPPSSANWGTTTGS